MIEEDNEEDKQMKETGKRIRNLLKDQVYCPNCAGVFFRFFQNKSQELIIHCITCGFEKNTLSKPKELKQKQEKKLKEKKMIEDNEEEDWKPCKCPYCGLDLDLHDGDGFCPAGTEEFGGRR